jgi:hypothetical protein
VEKLLLSAIQSTGAGCIRQNEIHAAEPFVLELSSAVIEIAVRKLKRYKAPGSDQIAAGQIQAGGGDCILRYINLLCCSGIKKNCPSSGKSQLSYLFTKGR